MHAMIRGTIAGAIALALGGCVVAIGTDEIERSASSRAQLERDNRQAIGGLQLGMTVVEVRNAMPHPVDLTEAFIVDGDEYRVLFYRTQRTVADGETTRDETTPLVFANGELVGWGESAWFDVTGRPLAAGD